jgi:hypothetical protein
MNLTATRIKKLIKRKITTAVLVTVSVAAFATSIGDGPKKGTKTAPEKLSAKTFSLKQSYDYRNNLLGSTRQKGRIITVNTVVTYQKGNATYILPLKKKVLLDKIKFNPAPSRY